MPFDLTILDFAFLGVLLLLVVFVVGIYRFAQLRQKKMEQQIDQFSQFQTAQLDKLGQIVKELKRQSRLLTEIIDEAANQPEYGMEYDSAETTEANETVFEDTPESAIEQVPSRQIYIGNLDYSTTETELYELFESEGEIESVNIPVNRYNGRARGFGFITFVVQADAERAVLRNGELFKGRNIQVNFAKEQKN